MGKRINNNSNSNSNNGNSDDPFGDFGDESDSEFSPAPAPATLTSLSLYHGSQGREDLDRPVYSYWILKFGLYGTFVFYGSEAQALELLLKTEARENEKGILRKADRFNPKDVELVAREIQAVREDRANGVAGLPYYPAAGWLT